MNSWTFQTPIYSEITPCKYQTSQFLNFSPCLCFEQLMIPESQIAKYFSFLPKQANTNLPQTAAPKKVSQKPKESLVLSYQSKQFPNSCKNIKANILKDFLRYIRRDSSENLLAIYSITSDYPIKKFIARLLEKLPSEGKYIKYMDMQQVCNDRQDREFSKILRVIFKKFLQTDYLLLVLSKKKNKFWYLKACRELQTKLFHQNLSSSPEN